MKRTPLSLILLLIITLWCNYTWAQATSNPVIKDNRNPITCNGSEGWFSFSGLLSSTTYQVTYNDDGVVIGPVTIASTAAGELTINGLNAGIYNNFTFEFNGSITSVLDGQRLSNPEPYPLFNSFAAFCAGSTPPVLPEVSNNVPGIRGTWNPAVVNNQTSGTYTFTPAAGTCGTQATLRVTVIPIKTAGFPFGTSLTICDNGAVPLLPNTDTNGITGTWTPDVVSKTTSGRYVFTPTSGGCVAGTTFDVTVNPIRPTTFPFGTNATICEGADVVTLSAQSSEGITGTWSPAVVSKTTSGTYTFTPNPGQCGTTATYMVTVNPNVTPTFDPVSPICSGDPLSALSTRSNNGITGSWSPALDNTTTTTYTFTPTAGLCARTATLTITVNQKETPTFDPVAPICAGTPLTALSTRSNNGITGSWSPALNNMATTTYTFTPDPGQCANTTTLTITVNPNITPTFTPVAPICSGEPLTALPTTSNNSITGSWSPALNNTATTTYTFTPDAGQCATTTTLTITVNPIVTPAFNAIAPICSGANMVLPTTSNNGITGTWSPAFNNTATTTYTFTPAAGQCATTTTLTVTVNPNIAPTFTPVAPICSGTTLAPLPTTSNNSITGTWSPALNNTPTTTYPFTPAAGVCATTTTLTITVDPKIIPTFTAVPPVCTGTTLTALPTTSNNGITGTWAPALNNTATTTYTFTPTPGVCATTTTLIITVDPKIIPTFTAVPPICTGSTLAALPTTSNNGITGTWAPALNNTATTTYTFTPTAGLCAATTTLTITVNQKATPTFAPVAPLCSGDTLAKLPLSSNNVTPFTGSWSPALNNTATTTYTFTPDAGLCAIPSTFTWQVNPTPSLISITRDTAVYDGAVLASYDFSVNDPAGGIKWNNSNPSIGLAASGTGTVPSFTATNMADTAQTAIITTIPFSKGCAGVSQSFKIKVLPLSKDVFVPNIFSPNGDGKNEELFIYGNYIVSVEMQIFNQWGQRLATLTDTHQGWDGKYKGSAQPVGVYLYVLKAALKDGRTVKMKGSITLIR